jgi:D-alanine-D-alanine ligase-like ATP-grasp enzyme
METKIIDINSEEILCHVSGPVHDYLIERCARDAGIPIADVGTVQVSSSSAPTGKIVSGERIVDRKHEWIYTDAPAPSDDEVELDVIRADLAANKTLTAEQISRALKVLL